MQRTPDRILVRGVNWLGDAVMTTPALLRLRERFPEAHVTMLTPAKLRDLWLNHPAVDATFSIDSGDNVFAVARKLRSGSFDTALVFPNSPRSAMEAWLARIPIRIGHARPWRNFFLTNAIPSRPGAVKMRKRSVAEIQQLTGKSEVDRKVAIPTTAHQINDFLHLTAALGANPEPLPPQLSVTQAEIDHARSDLGLVDSVYKHPFFGINAGAEYGPAKRWPADNFISTALAVRQRIACNWIIFGGPADQRLAETIAQGIDSAVYNIAGKTSLRELMAALKLCRVLLTNDTGPMHLAAALGVPVVVPFGSTSPELTGPVSAAGVRHQLLKATVPCSPCFLRECPIDFRCMNSISVAQVVDAVCRAAIQ